MLGIGHYFLTTLDCQSGTPVFAVNSPTAIFCGECGHAMQGNSRISGRSKERYISYRCGQKDRGIKCNNKEIRREYIEAFVLSELQSKLFNDDVIPVLTEKLNAQLI